MHRITARPHLHSRRTPEVAHDRGVHWVGIGVTQAPQQLVESSAASRLHVGVIGAAALPSLVNGVGLQCRDRGVPRGWGIVEARGQPTEVMTARPPAQLNRRGGHVAGVERVTSPSQATAAEGAAPPDW